MPNLDKFVLDLTAKMINFVRSEYNAPDFEVKIRCDYGAYRKCSWGGMRNGRNFISLALNKYSLAAANDEEVTFNEYPNFATDVNIGSVTASWQKALAALIAHEMAHAVELGSIKSNAASAHGISGAGKHGKLWKEIYRKFRINFVNSAVFNDSPIIQNTSSISKIEQIKPKKTYNKTWRSESDHAKGGIIIRYFVNNIQVGTIFRRGAGSLYVYRNRTWEKLMTRSLCEARKLCFNI